MLPRFFVGENIFDCFRSQTSNGGIFGHIVFVFVRIMIQKVLMAPAKCEKLENVLRVSNLMDVFSEIFNIFHTDLETKRNNRFYKMTKRILKHLVWNNREGTA